ncbi:cyclic nucleotide-binding protein, partial [Pedobacter sp. IW39]
DLAMFYIKYMENTWIVEKKSFGITIKHIKMPENVISIRHQVSWLNERLKQHHVALLPRIS